MKRKHQRTVELIYSRPVSANVRWSDVEALFKALGAEIAEREGSRIEVFLFGVVRIFHRPHRSPNNDSWLPWPDCAWQAGRFGLALEPSQYP